MNQCEVCNKSFKVHYALVEHYRVHTGERPYKCNICQKGFRQKGHLTDHVRVHSDERPYSCDSCGRDFKQSSGLHNHRVKYHQKMVVNKVVIPKRRSGRQQKPKPEPIRNEVENSFRNDETSGQQAVEIDVENLHKCDFCDETFPNVKKMENHIKWHTLRKCYKCNVCGNSFKYLGVFRKHRKLHDKRQEPYDNSPQQHNNMFNIEPQDPEKIQDVKSKVKLSFCKTCHKKFSCPFTYQRHIKEFHKGLKRTKGVSRIGNNANTASSSQQHVKNIHAGIRRSKPKKFKCYICRKKFANVNSRAVHLQRIHLLRTHKCHICGKAYGVANDLKIHYKTHRVDKLYECDVCGKPFQCKSKLKEHYVVHNKQKQEHLQLKDNYITHDKQRSSRTISEGPCKCKVCGKRFRFPSRLNEHLIVHAGEQPSTPNTEWPHQCNVCQKMYRYPSRLREHYKIKHQLESPCSEQNSEGQYKCDVCTKTFPFESHLRRHLTIHNKEQQDSSSSRPLYKEGPYECDVCGRIFRYPSQLREHHVVHEKRKRCEASSCTIHSEGSYKDMQKQEPTTSIQAQEPHTITPYSKGHYECDVCGNTFQCKSVLLRHCAVHKDEEDHSLKPYPCHFCSRAFWQTNHLKRHCQVQHNTDKPFKCDVCAVAFEKKAQYNGHLHTCPVQLAKNGTGSSTKMIPAKFATQGGSQHAERRAGRPQKKSKVSTENGISEYETHGTESMGKSIPQCTEKSTGTSGKKHNSGTNIHGTTSKDGLRKVKRGAGRSVKKYTLTTKKRSPTCNICGARFGSNGSLRMHLDIHFDRRPYSCRFCEMKFRQPGHLSSHCTHIHGEEFPYQCDSCEMTFKRLAAFQKHKEIAHGVIEKSDELYDVGNSAIPRYSNIDFEPKQYTRIVNSEQTEYACRFCDSSSRTFKSLSGLRRHITIIHTASAKQPVSESGQAQSTFDSRGVVTMTRIGSPMKISQSEEIYKCNVCSVIVHGSEALGAHENAHAKAKSPHSTPPMSSFAQPILGSIEQTFECKFCGREFDSMSREAFDQHQLEHEFAAEEPMGMAYICVECDKEFAMANDMIKHHEEDH